VGDQERPGDDRIESLPAGLHERIRLRFLELARREPQRYLVLDASEPREQIQAAIRVRVRDLAPISQRHRAELAARLSGEEDRRRRRAEAEAEVRRLDARLRGRSRDEARARQESMRRAREDAEREVRAQAATLTSPEDPLSTGLAAAAAAGAPSASAGPSAARELARRLSGEQAQADVTETGSAARAGRASPGPEDQGAQEPGPEDLPLERPYSPQPGPETPGVSPVHPPGWRS
jgi:dTMP kinase